MEQRGVGGGELNGAWRKWGVAVSLAGLILAVGGYVFGAGRIDAAFDQRLTRMEADVQLMRTEYARRDVFEQRLTIIEKAQERIEKNEQQQAQKLDEILMEERKRPR